MIERHFDIFGKIQRQRFLYLTTGFDLFQAKPLIMKQFEKADGVSITTDGATTIIGKHAIRGMTVHYLDTEFHSCWAVLPLEEKQDRTSTADDIKARSKCLSIFHCGE